MTLCGPWEGKCGNYINCSTQLLWAGCVSTAVPANMASVRLISSLSFVWIVLIMAAELFWLSPDKLMTFLILNGILAASLALTVFQLRNRIRWCWRSTFSGNHKFCVLVDTDSLFLELCPGRLIYDQPFPEGESPVLALFPNKHAQGPRSIKLDIGERDISRAFPCFPVPFLGYDGGLCVWTEVEGRRLLDIHFFDGKKKENN